MCHIWAAVSFGSMADLVADLAKELLAKSIDRRSAINILPLID
jgi:hypothetical protein